MTRDTDDGRGPPGDGADSTGAEAETSNQLRADGGTDATGADEVALNPWGSSTVDDYRKLFEEFGIEAFDDVIGEVPTPHYLMRRGVIFGHREYRRVADASATRVGKRTACTANRRGRT